MTEVRQRPGSREARQGAVAYAKSQATDVLKAKSMTDDMTIEAGAGERADQRGDRTERVGFRAADCTSRYLASPTINEAAGWGGGS